ncbi:AAA family ATPase [Ancylobacter radicis]|uniref:MoxR family ATPase n=1 Tax=Ancylobacter radicis TaxID=2836179 RepID=A0ABS5R3X8_9HYPH|nr:MoxR family ATPase [Ancylobacter radicis]MBS9476368.1 MoxR family ATPase [Ancylobacter radicis]
MRVVRETDSVLADWRGHAQRFEREVAKVVLGQDRVIRLITIATFARGHVLLEGDVGVGKTTLLRAVARAIGGAFERIEGTIDLMPADLIYHAHLGEDGRPRIDPGPLLRQGEDLSVFFFNEINRARPQVHSLMLRLMAERSVSAFNREYRFPHVQVFADRNKVEREETFELPAAARDRFLMEVQVGMPADDASRRQLVFDPRFHNVDTLLTEVETGVLDPDALETVARAIQSGVRSSEALEAYTLALWDAVRRPEALGIEIDGVDIRRLVQGGASPRGMSYLLRAARVRAWLEGRDIVVPEDLRAVFPEVMAHRIFIDPVYELRRERVVGDLIAGVFERVPAP